MRRLVSPIAALAGLLAASAAFAAPPTDVAELFPPGVLAYAELSKPGTSADAVAAFVKGTALADSLASSHDRRDALQRPEQLPAFQQSQLPGLLTSPEALAEVRKCRGGAVALTGFDAKSGRPRWAGAVILGDATGLGFLVRTYLTTSANVRRVGSVDGVTVYQNRGLTGGAVGEDGKVKPAEDPVPPEGDGEITYLYAPGLLAVGSGKAAVADVYRRFEGKGGASLAAGEAFSKRADDRAKPGLFLYADPSRLEKGYDAARKAAKLESIDPAVFALVRFMLNSRSVSAVRGNLLVQSDAVGLVLSADVEAGAECPLVELLRGGVTAGAELRVAGTDAPAGVTFTLPPKEKRAKSILAVADAIAKANGVMGALPSDLTREADAAGDKWASDILPGVRALTLFVPAKQELPKGVPPLPMVVLHADDADAAKACEATVPKLVRMMTGEKALVEPSSEMVAGVKVFGVVAAAGGQRWPVHFARNGDLVVFGLDRKRVAAAAGLDPAAKPAAVVAKGNDLSPAAFGYVKLGRVARWVTPSVVAAQQGPGGTYLQPGGAQRGGLGGIEKDLLVDPGSELPVKPGSDPEKQPEPPDAKKPPADPAKEKEKEKKDELPDPPHVVMEKAFAAVPPLTLELAAKGDTLRVEVWHRTADKKSLSAAIVAFLTWYESAGTPTDGASVSRNPLNGGPVGGGIGDVIIEVQPGSGPQPPSR